MKKLFALLGFVFAVAMLQAQAQTAEDSVKATVNTLFKAMKNADAGTLLDCFTDSAMLQTILRDKQGKIIVRSETVEEFGKQVATMAKDAGDERIVFETIKIDGAMANVWTPYKFYFNGKFSHCGVNNFVLVKVDNQWKIQYIIDTRRRVGCE